MQPHQVASQSGRATQRLPGCFSGDLVRRVDLAGLLITEVMTPPGLVVPVHAHPRAYLEVVLEGHWCEFMGSEVREMAPGTVFFHPVGECHHDTFSSKHTARTVHVELGGGWLDRLIQGRFDTASPAAARSSKVNEPMVRLAREIRRLDSWSALAIEGCVLECVAELGKAAFTGSSKGPPPWLGRFEELLREGGLPGSLCGVAREFGVDPSVLTRAFKKRHGCTPSEFARRVRVERAAEALATTDLPLSTVAIRCGFADQSHLTRVFARFHGITPGAYRARRNARPSR